MSDDNQNQVQFEGESNALYSRFEPSNKRPALIDFILKLGIVQDETRANYVLIGFVVMAVITVLFLIFGGVGTVGNPNDIKILPAEL